MLKLAAGGKEPGRVKKTTRSHWAITATARYCLKELSQKKVLLKRVLKPTSKRILDFLLFLQHSSKLSQGWKPAPTTRCYHSAGFDNGFVFLSLFELFQSCYFPPVFRSNMIPEGQSFPFPPFPVFAILLFYCLLPELPIRVSPTFLVGK